MVTLLATEGTKSLDLYARNLAMNLDVPQIHSDVYQQINGAFNISLFSIKSVKAVREDWQFIRSLRQVNGIIHLPNHHLGRYGLFLGKPYIITVHDIIRYLDLTGQDVLIRRPNLRDRLYLALDYKGVKKAARVIAVSRATKQDLIHHLGIPEERISVVYEGIDHQVFKPSRRRLIDHPYVLFVGSEHPRKNFIGVLRAFGALKKDGSFEELKLVKVGRAGGAEAEFRKESLKVIDELGLREEVIFTDYVAEEDLAAYYSSAECFVLPSFYEGFGFPPLEAMACGCPAIVSNRSSLPEVTGEAAIQVDPDDADGIATSLHRVLTDRELTRRLVDRGFERAAGFTWERAAAQTFEVYREVEESLRTSKELPDLTRRVRTSPAYQYQHGRRSSRFEAGRAFAHGPRATVHPRGGEARRISSPGHAVSGDPAPMPQRAPANPKAAPVAGKPVTGPQAPPVGRTCRGTPGVAPVIEKMQEKNSR